MNIIYEELPKSVEINGMDYEIITDFREWVRFSDMIRDRDIPDDVKLYLTRQMFLGDISFSEDLTPGIVLEAFVKFLSREDTKQGQEERPPKKRGRPLFSYEFDGPYIIAAFLHDYGIDLIGVEYMHWYKFMALFDGLGDNTQIKQRIHYRSIDLSDIKDKDERKRIRRIQNSIRIPDEIMSDGEIANAFV